MSFFLVFLAILLVGVTLWAGSGGRKGFPWRRANADAGAGADTGASAPGLLDRGFDQPGPNLPPVLLPAQAKAADVDRVRFALGLRGYRMDQVDQVLDELRDQLAAAEREVADLRARLSKAEAAEAGSAAGSPKEDA